MLMLRQAILFFCLCRLFQNTQFRELEASRAVDYIAKIDPKTFCLGTGVSGVILAEPVTDRSVSLGMEDQPVPILVLDSTMCHRSKRTKAHLLFYRLRDISDWREYSLDFRPLKTTTAGVWPTRIEVSTDGNTMPCISSTLHKYRIRW